MATMLAVETKRADRVDWVGKLTSYIRANYADTPPDQYTAAVAALAEMRVAAMSPDKNEQTVESLFTYYYQLTLIEGRFPLAPAAEGGIDLTFGWYDAYRGKLFTDAAGGFEKASILFNIAALLSQLGAMQTRNEVEGIKRACQLFQRAAGVLLHLRDNVYGNLQAIGSPDLAQDSLTMLINLNLAQAQENVYEKADLSNMKDGILAKLAAQVAEFYDVAHTLIAGPSLANSFHKSWPNHILLRSLVFRAAAQYHQSQVELANDMYGEEIARLEHAAEVLAQAVKLTKGVPTDVEQQVIRLHAKVNARLKTAHKENDTIYCQPVPSLDAVETITKKALVKPLEIPEPSELGVSDLFRKMVPLAVIQAASMYSAQKEGLVREAVDGALEATGMAHSTLASLNLPASIEALEVPQGLPATLRDKAGSVRQEGGLAAINSLIDTLSSIAGTDREMIAQCTAVLDEEEEADTLIKNQYGVRWTRTPSRTLTQNLRQEVRACLNTYEEAQRADSIVQNKLEAYGSTIETFMLPEQELAAILPTATGSPLKDHPAVGELKTYLVALEAVLTERENLCGLIREMGAQDDATEALMAGGTGTEDAVISRELGKYAELRAQIASNVEAQGRLLEAISAKNAEFNAARGPDDAQSQREIMLGNFDAAFNTYREVSKQVKEGITFYTNFQDVLSKLKYKCDDFCFARNTEKQDMLAQLQAAPQMGAYGAGVGAPQMGAYGGQATGMGAYNNAHMMGGAGTSTAAAGGGGGLAGYGGGAMGGNGYAAPPAVAPNQYGGAAAASTGVTGYGQTGYGQAGYGQAAPAQNYAAAPAQNYAAAPAQNYAAPPAQNKNFAAAAPTQNNYAASNANNYAAAPAQNNNYAAAAPAQNYGGYTAPPAQAPTYTAPAANYNYQQTYAAPSANNNNNNNNYYAAGGANSGSASAPPVTPTYNYQQPQATQQQQQQYQPAPTGMYTAQPYAPTNNTTANTGGAAPNPYQGPNNGYGGYGA